jgi:hypothetical protein
MNRKPAAKTAKAIREKVAVFARVQRPSLLDFLLGAFYSLPKLPQAVIDSPAVRTYEYDKAGWTVPADSLGRKGTDVLETPAAARSAAESIRLWIAKNVPTIDVNKIAVVVETVGDELAIRIYRKA